MHVNEVVRAGGERDCVKSEGRVYWGWDIWEKNMGMRMVDVIWGYFVWRFCALGIPLVDTVAINLISLVSAPRSGSRPMHPPEAISVLMGRLRTMQFQTLMFQRVICRFQYSMRRVRLVFSAGRAGNPSCAGQSSGFAPKIWQAKEQSTRQIPEQEPHAPTDNQPSAVAPTTPPPPPPTRQNGEYPEFLTMEESEGRAKC